MSELYNQMAKMQEETLKSFKPKNTEPEFFSLWSLRQLQDECARLNQVIKEASELTWKLDKTFEGNEVEKCVLCGKRIAQENSNVCKNCGKTLPY